MSGRNKPASTKRTSPDPVATAREKGTDLHRQLITQAAVVPSTHDSSGSEGLLDYAEAAHYLCTTPRHVRELWAKRCIAAVKVGRHVRFARGDLDAFIKARRVDALH